MKGWAGCNVYWEKTYINEDGTTGRLTFDDVGDTRHKAYQGVYFKFGSLIAISPSGNYDASSCVIYSPTKTKDYQYINIPFAGEDVMPCQRNESYLRKIHNVELGLGDICKYITDMGWAPGSKEHKRWRMPTAIEVAPGPETWPDFSMVDVPADPSSKDGTAIMSLESKATKNTNIKIPHAGMRKNTGTLVKNRVSCAILTSSCTTTGKPFIVMKDDYPNPDVLTDLKGMAPYVNIAAPIRCVTE